MFKFDDNSLIKSASYASVIISSVIMIAKAYGCFVTNSESMFASLIDSTLDISSSLINLVAIRVALSPPDDNHRFGHEKFQDLAIFSQSVFFFASCLLIMHSSVKALFNQPKLYNYEAGANVMFFCLGLTIVLVIYQSFVIRKTHSRIIVADKIHYFTDFLSNLMVIISLNLSRRLWYFDPIAGVCISFYICYASYKLFKQAIKNLADEEFAQDDKDKIIAVVRNRPEVRGLHELKTRYAANKPFIQFHIELRGELTLHKSHEIAEQIMNDLIIIFPLAEIIIHQDPDGVEKNVNYREKI